MYVPFLIADSDGPFSIIWLIIVFVGIFSSVRSAKKKKEAARRQAEEKAAQAQGYTQQAQAYAQRAQQYTQQSAYANRGPQPSAAHMARYGTLHAADAEKAQPGVRSSYSDQTRVASAFHRQAHIQNLNIADYGKGMEISFKGLPQGTDEMAVLTAHNAAYEKSLTHLLHTRQ